MRTTSLLLLTFVSLATLALPVRADIESSMPTRVRVREGHGRRSGPRPVGKNPDTIRGVCSIQPSSDNPIPGPCVNLVLVLVLNEANGNDVVITRTNPQGQFDFTATRGKTYLISSGSQFYDVVAPKSPVRGGQNVALVLQQK